MGSSSSKPCSGCCTPCPDSATYVKEECKWWQWWCSPKEECVPKESLAPSTSVMQPATKYIGTTIPFSCVTGNCEGHVEYLDGCDAEGCTGNICGAGWELATDVETICGKEAGLSVDRQCDPGKGFFQGASCRQTSGGSKVFAVWDYNLDSGTCWVSWATENTIYRPYIWDGCPGFTSSDPDWFMRYGLYTSDKTETQQRPIDGGVGETATCIELGGGKTLSNQPPTVDSKSGFTEASTLPLIGKSHTVEGVGAIGGIGAAAVLGFGFMRSKKRQAKKKTAAQDLEMSGGNAV